MKIIYSIVFVSDEARKLREIQKTKETRDLFSRKGERDEIKVQDEISIARF